MVQIDVQIVVKSAVYSTASHYTEWRNQDSNLHCLVAEPVCALNHDMAELSECVDLLNMLW